MCICVWLWVAFGLMVDWGFIYLEDDDEGEGFGELNRWGGG